MPSIRTSALKIRGRVEYPLGHGALKRISDQILHLTSLWPSGYATLPHFKCTGLNTSHGVLMNILHCVPTISPMLI